jgi:RHS repeat-associated protein
MAGNRTSKTVLPVNLTSNFSYDPNYQLTQVMQGTKRTEGYTYDAVGNRLYQPGVPYTYNNSNEMLTREGVPYTYDANGSTLTKTNGSGTTSYAWDFENRLTSVTLPGTGGAVTFKYDPFGRRIYKGSPSGPTVYVYDGDNIIEELNADGSLGERYTYGPGVDEPLVGQRQPKVFYYEADGLGSITSLTDPAGALAATYTYDSFGFLTASTGSATNWFRYTARQFDSSTALYYYRARYYDPSIGRFISEDPVRMKGGINSYRYVSNSPINLGDPSGLCPEGWAGLTQDQITSFLNAGQDLTKLGLSHNQMDCSHFVYQALTNAGIDVGGYASTAGMWGNPYYESVNQADVSPGDLLMFATTSNGGQSYSQHVVIANGADFLGSQNSTGPATVTNWQNNNYWNGTNLGTIVGQQTGALPEGGYRICLPVRSQ